MANLRPEHFEEWRDRRLTETASRGKPGGRGSYKPEVPKPPKLRKDGQPRKNAAKPKAPPKPPTTISPATVNRELTLLKRAIDFSRKRLNLATNPINREDVERFTVNDERDVRLSAADWQKLLAECKKSRNLWLAPMVEIAVEIGARRSSLLKLEWSDLTVEDAAAALRDVKNSRRPNEIRNVEIGLSPRAIEILQELPRSLDGRVFPTTDAAIKAAFKRARARAKLEHFRFHDTRHEFASIVVEAGWEISDVMKQGDWRDPKSLARYYNPRGKHLGAKLAQIKKA